ASDYHRIPCNCHEPYLTSSSSRETGKALRSRPPGRTASGRPGGFGLIAIVSPAAWAYLCVQAQEVADKMVPAMAGGEPAPGPGGGPGARGEVAREVLALRNIVAVYRHLSGLAVQNADLATVARLIAEQTDATVAIVSPTMDILT